MGEMVEVRKCGVKCLVQAVAAWNGDGSQIAIIVGTGKQGILFFMSREEDLKLAIRCNRYPRGLFRRVAWPWQPRRRRRPSKMDCTCTRVGAVGAIRGCVAIDVILRLSVEAARLGIW